MRSVTLLQGLFILYCVEIGILLLILPWGPAWDRQIVALPFAGDFLLNPWIRSSLSAFGVIHLVWGIHDLYFGFFARGNDDGSTSTDRIGDL